jgi:hypothetical protein
LLEAALVLWAFRSPALRALSHACDQLLIGHMRQPL